MDRSKHSKAALAGWLVAAGLLGIVVGGGFNSAEEKFGVVNLRKVIFDSKLNQEMTDRVEAARLARVSILEFMNTNQVLTEEQATRIRELELKDDRTDEEKTELENVQQAVIAAAKDFDRISEIQAPTEDERLLYQDYTQRRNTTRGLLQAWTEEFERDFAALRDQATQDAIDLAQVAATAVASKEGYTTVFSATAVIYAANDLTEAVTAEANK